MGGAHFGFNQCVKINDSFKNIVVFLLKNILPEDPKFLFMLRRGEKIITYNSTLFFHVSS